MRRIASLFIIPILLLSACVLGSGYEDKHNGGDPQLTSTKEENTEPQIKSVLIPEGYTFWQIAQKLESEGICKAKAFFDAAQSYEVQSFAVTKDDDIAYRYEGYLFPATYDFYVGEDPVEVLKKMLNAYAEHSGMPDLKTLILASIIEREVRSDEHMSMVSSVFHNRVNRGSEQGVFTLGSCPTQDYVKNYIVQEGTWIKNPDRFRTLYDTYYPLSEFNSKHTPLPAGPICSPGIRAINAAKNPAESDYFFFFFSADNENHYSKSYSEHKQKIAKYGLGEY